MRAIGSVLLFATAVVAGAARAEQDNYVDVQRGKALATIGDCIACHSDPGGFVVCQRPEADIRGMKAA